MSSMMWRDAYVTSSLGASILVNHLMMSQKSWTGDCLDNTLKRYRLAKLDEGKSSFLLG